MGRPGPHVVPTSLTWRNPRRALSALAPANRDSPPRTALPQVRTRRRCEQAGAGQGAPRLRRAASAGQPRPPAPRRRSRSRVFCSAAGRGRTRWKVSLRAPSAPPAAGSARRAGGRERPRSGLAAGRALQHGPAVPGGGRPDRCHRRRPPRPLRLPEEKCGSGLCWCGPRAPRVCAGRLPAAAPEPRPAPQPRCPAGGAGRWRNRGLLRLQKVGIQGVCRRKSWRKARPSSLGPVLPARLLAEAVWRRKALETFYFLLARHLFKMACDQQTE